METIEYTTFDKSNWGPGPWQHEPDKRQWLDEATGFPCLIVRSAGSGALCGYVGLPKDHPDFGKSYDDISDYEAHGGLTFAGSCRPNADESKHICHKADGDDHVWWLGFDCAHYGDISPAYEARSYHKGLASLADDHESYKDFDYVTKEVTVLAATLKTHK